MRVNSGDTFDIGSKAQKGGLYVCAPCGKKQRFRKNQKFPRCFSCMEGKSEDGSEYVKDLGLWEFIEE